MNVGYWIHGRSRDYNPFVAHRVGEIQEASDPEQWCYVPTDLNPANLGTRGLDVGELMDNCHRWGGPEFSKQSKDKWPTRTFGIATEEARKEIRIEVQS